MTHANTYETTISHITEGDAKDEYVVIETSEKTVMSALEKKPHAFEKVWEDQSPGCPRLVRFRIPLDSVNWGGMAKSKRRGRPFAPAATNERSVA